MDNIKTWTGLPVEESVRMSSRQSCSKKGTVRHRQSKEASILWSHYEETRELPGEEIMQGTIPGSHRRGRPHTAWMDNIKTWTGLSVKKSIRMTEDREINGESTSMVWPTLGWRTAKEQNRTEQNTAVVAVPRWEQGGTGPSKSWLASTPNLASLPQCIHCGQLGPRKSSKFDATRCQILRLKCTKFDFR